MRTLYFRQKFELSMYWNKYSSERIKQRVFSALQDNQSFYNKNIMGIPATYLDPGVFPISEKFLENAPFIRTMVENPNHIGVHTHAESVAIYSGTHELEIELLALCAMEMFKAKENEYDAYVATGGTEANIQAIWTYRNYFLRSHLAKMDEIVVVYSQDSHYSMPKACNILGCDRYEVPVDPISRQMSSETFNSAIKALKTKGKNYFIFVLNMSTTMFGSVDDDQRLIPIIKSNHIEFKIHVDAAFGGFIYPFSNPQFTMHFGNLDISSISVDAHKMLQAPYGTGLYFVRKELMPFVETEEAQYIEGKDYSICGSRSGANAVCVWMILRYYGSDGLRKRNAEFIERTDYLCQELNRLHIKYFRQAHMNIVTIPDGEIPREICEKFTLVPDSHHKKTAWWKIVVMDHVDLDTIYRFIEAVEKEKTVSN